MTDQTPIMQAALHLAPHEQVDVTKQQVASNPDARAIHSLQSLTRDLSLDLALAQASPCHAAGNIAQVHARKMPHMSAVAFSFSSKSFCLPSFLGVCLISLVLQMFCHQLLAFFQLPSIKLKGSHGGGLQMQRSILQTCVSDAGNVIQTCGREPEATPAQTTPRACPALHRGRQCCACSASARRRGAHSGQIRLHSLLCSSRRRCGVQS